MTRVTEPLREEHQDLLPRVAALKATADALSGGSAEVLHDRIGEACEFLTGHLIPHAIAEDRVLYPVVCRVMGSDSATKTMSRDHVEVGKLTDELGRLRGEVSGAIPSEATKNELRRVLYGLYTLVQVHFAKEEEVYLPLLDERLDETSAAEMFEAMEKAASEAKAVGH